MFVLIHVIFTQNVVNFSQLSVDMFLDVQLIFYVCLSVCADQEVGDGSSSVGAQGFPIRASPKTTPR